MRQHDVIRSSYLEFVGSAGLTRKSKSWYRRTDETIVVLTLARLPYGRQYSLAVGVVLRALDADGAPKQKDCAIRGRLDRLVPADVEHHLNDLLDLTIDIPDSNRRAQLLELFRSELAPLLDRASSLEGLRSDAGRHILRHATVDESARELLAQEV